MTSFITVVIEEELSTVKKQAQSLAQYCDIDVDKIVIVINQEDVLEIEPAWWGHLSSKVEVYHRNEFNTIKDCHGWISQQILKLQATQKSNTTWSIVLDAKTIFTNYVSTMFVNDKPACGTIPIPEVFSKSRDIVNKLFNIRLYDCIGPGGVPFFFKNDLVRELIEFVERKTKQPFNDWFVDQGLVTEFILYSAFVTYKYQTPSVLYEDKNFNVWNVCHSQAKEYDLWFTRLTNLNPATVSVHRNAWPQLSAEQQRSFNDFLATKGIS